MHSPEPTLEPAAHTAGKGLKAAVFLIAIIVPDLTIFEVDDPCLFQNDTAERTTVESRWT
jgi:hypothetical protein